MVEGATGSKAASLIARGATFSIAGLLVRAGARVLFLVVAGQLYGAALFGAYSLAEATIELAVAVAGLGMKRVLFQLLDGRAARPSEHVLADAVVLVAGVSLALSALFVCAAWFLGAGIASADTSRALMVLAPLIGGQALLDVFLAATRWRQRIRFEVLTRSVVEPYALIIAAAAAWYAGYGGTGLLIAYWCGTLAALAYALWGVARAFDLASLVSYRLSGDRLWTTLRFAAANTSADALSALYLRLDLLLVGILLGERAAGIYGMARQLAVPVRQIRGGFDGMLIPMVSKTLHVAGTVDAGRAIASATRLVLALQLPIVIALVAAGRPLLDWLGVSFGDAWLAAVLLTAAETVQGAYGIGDLLFVYRRPNLGLAITVGTLLFGLAAGIAFTMGWGVSGTAAAVLLTYALRAWLRRAALKASLGVAVPLHHSAAPLTAGAAGVAAALLPVAWPIALVAGLLLYLLILVAWLRAAGETLGLKHFIAE